MKKPTYIKISLPAPEKYFKPAIVKYFNEIHGEKASIDFSIERSRKDFKYDIYLSKAETWYSAFDSKKKTRKFVICLKLIDEKIKNWNQKNW